jgi:hypothetical protein
MGTFYEKHPIPSLGACGIGFKKEEEEHTREHLGFEMGFLSEIAMNLTVWIE